jgi:hypothetical protein
MKITLPIFSLILFLVLPIQGQSEKLYFTENSNSDQLPEKMIEDGIKMILNALELFIQKMPNYEKPEILENGDIIIRRVKPDQSKPSEGEKTLGKPDTRI